LEPGKDPYNGSDTDVLPLHRNECSEDPMLEAYLELS
jgi:hypothetical protein